MKIKLSELRKIVKEELDSVNESKVGFNDLKVGSWVRFVGGLPEYHDELKIMWDLMISGAYNKDELQKIPSELHRGVRFHALQINKKAQEGAVYPTWDEVIDRLRELVAKQKADRAARAKIPTGYRADPKYQAASDHEKERWHQYGGDPSDPGRARGLGT